MHIRATLLGIDHLFDHLFAVHVFIERVHRYTVCAVPVLMYTCV